jgi:plasmid stability protein
MATLYVENVPDEVYESLRKHAQKERRSISAEVIRLLEEKFPTAAELERRREAWRKIEHLQFTRSENAENLPDSVDMIREDRDR